MTANEPVNLADRRRGGNIPPDAAEITVAETGWNRLDGHTMRWVGEPIPHATGRDALELRGHARGLAITTAYIPQGTDLNDPGAVADELEDGWPAVVPLQALYVLRHALNSAITAMEQNQAAAGTA